MPTFYSGGITVQLSTADLRETSTTVPAHNQCPETTRNTKRTADVIAQASVAGTLAEDAIEDQSTGSHFRWVGNDRDVPFLLVRAGEGYFQEPRRVIKPARLETLKQLTESAVSEDQSRKRFQDSQTIENLSSEQFKQLQKECSYSAAPESEAPQNAALCLNVFLSRKTFYPITNEDTSGVKFADLRIDVFFNGKLFDSSVVGARFRNAGARGVGQISRFTGQNIHLMVEKPWVLRAFSSDTHGNVNMQSGKGSDRWTTISSLLRNEIRKYGITQDGERSVSGEYLDGLAQVPVPDEVNSLNDHDGNRLAIIDVMIVYGEGSRLGPETPYVAGPTAPRLIGFQQPLLPVGWQATDHQKQSTDKYIEQRLGTPTFTPRATARSSRKVSRRQSKSSVGEDNTLMNDDDENGMQHLLNHIGAENSSIKEAAFAELHDQPTQDVDMCEWSSQDDLENYVQAPNSDTKSADAYRGSRTAYSIGQDKLSFEAPSQLSNNINFNGQLSFHQSPTSQAANALLNLSMPQTCLTSPPIDPALAAWAAQNSASYLPGILQLTHPSPGGSAPLTRTPSFQASTDPFATTAIPSPTSSALTTPPPSTPEIPSCSLVPKLSPERPSKWVKITLASPTPKRKPRTTRRSFARTSKPSTKRARKTRTLTPPPPTYHGNSPSMQSHPSEEPLSEPVPATISLEEIENFTSALAPESEGVIQGPDLSKDDKKQRRQTNVNATKYAENKPLDQDFDPGELDEGCRVGFAEAGVVRNVPTRRGGWFKERGIVVGMRFCLW
ncbi:uncharacterized protein KY384_001429 [Bacidia gigantensis]|uniref:uncharacterized protein n=1 Tax=Bacidia gigantensis TaxID=2732470 RepID=UPI001D055EE1|nr:uncharacterized protein KY384_001429 [Bacidia gigantensis]KAG8533688.1 hypothetical protein KY384_001429 [Bacidia gigantensis]